MRLRLTLLSGEEAVLTLAPDTTVHELKLKAQREFGIHELVSSKGTEFFDDEFFWWMRFLKKKNEWVVMSRC